MSKSIPNKEKRLRISFSKPIVMIRRAPCKKGFFISDHRVAAFSYLRGYEGFSGLAGGRCLFAAYQWGKPQAAESGNAEGLRLVEPTPRRGQDSPGDKSLKTPARLPARRAYAPEGTEEKPSYPSLPRDQLR
jgi:hypothetical protein